MDDDTIQADELMLMTGLKWTTIMSLFKAGDFPTPIYREPSEVCWLREDIDDWLDSHTLEKSGASKFYVVWLGRKPGIYNKWSDVKKQIFGKIKPKFKRFDSISEAEDAFIDGSKKHIGF